MLALIFIILYIKYFAGGGLRQVIIVLCLSPHFVLDELNFNSGRLGKAPTTTRIPRWGDLDLEGPPSASKYVPFLQIGGRVVEDAPSSGRENVA